MTARITSRTKTRKATKTFTRTLLPWAGAGWGGTEADSAIGDGTGGVANVGAAPGAPRTAAPHLLQNLTLPTGEPHCLQKAMKLRSLVVNGRRKAHHRGMSRAEQSIKKVGLSTPGLKPVLT